MLEINTRDKNIPEYLSKDILEDNFVNTFLYIYRLQFVLGSSRVVTKNRFVTPPTKLQKFYTILCVTLSLVLIYAWICFWSIKDASVKALDIFFLLIICVTSFCNVVHVRFLNGRQNAEFHVKMQKLDRLMNIEKNKTISSYLKRINAASMLLVMIVFVSLNALTVVFDNFNWAAFIFILLNFFPLILELIACSSIVASYFVRVRLVNFLIGSYLGQDENVKNPKVMEPVSLKWIGFVAPYTDSHFTTSEIHIYLKEIFQCFMTFQELYSFQLLLFCMKLVVCSLVSFQMAFYTLRESIFEPTKFGPLMFEIIDVIIAVCLAIHFEVFYSEVKETKRLCLNVLALHQEGPSWEKARSTLKMIDEAPPRFSVYDMWVMNAGMFVTIFGMVTGLMVTMIQFTIM